MLILHPMRAMIVEQPGPTASLALHEDLPLPAPAAGELLIRLRYTALNRADLFQKQGLYPPPPGASPLLGLECSGEVVAVGEGVTGKREGDMVCALLEGGGYAEYAVAPAGQCLPIPTGWSLREAAALPEALFTVWLAAFHTAGLQRGESILFHSGASGIGSLGIQLAKAAGAIPFATAGSDEKTAFCLKLGAAQAVNYRQEDMADAFAESCPSGLDIIIDPVGSAYFQMNLSLAARHGRIVSLAFLSGAKAEVNMAPLAFKQLAWHGMTLRSRSREEKALLAQEIRNKCWRWLEEKRAVPVIDSEFPLKEAEKAHERMQQNLNLGKILLNVAQNS